MVVALIGAGIAKIGEVGLEASQAMAKLSATTGKTGEAGRRCVLLRRKTYLLKVLGKDLGGAIEWAKMDVALKGLATPAEIEKIAYLCRVLLETTGQDLDEING